MAATKTQLTEFGKRLRAARINAGYTSAEKLARAIVDAGYSCTGSGVTAWERGDQGVETPDKLETLEQLVGTNGELAALLGVTAPTDLRAEIAEIRAQVAELTRIVEQIATARTPRKRA